MNTKTYTADAGEKERILKRLTDILVVRDDILFAFVHGSFTGDLPFHDIAAGSDIDLLVVTNDDFFISNYDEKMKLHLRVSAALREIIKQVPVDLIVYTRPTYKKFMELGSMFSKEIQREGKYSVKKISREWLKAASDDLRYRPHLRIRVPVEKNGRV